MPKIQCAVCGAGPAAEDGACALFANKDGEGRRLFCAECLPLPAVKARLDRYLGPPLEPGVIAIFSQRLAARS